MKKKKREKDPLVDNILKEIKDQPPIVVGPTKEELEELQSKDPEAFSKVLEKRTTKLPRERAKGKS